MPLGSTRKRSRAKTWVLGNVVRAQNLPGFSNVKNNASQAAVCAVTARPGQHIGRPRDCRGRHPNAAICIPSACTPRASTGTARVIPPDVRGPAQIDWPIAAEETRLRRTP